MFLEWGMAIEDILRGKKFPSFRGKGVFSGCFFRLIIFSSTNSFYFFVIK